MVFRLHMLFLALAPSLTFGQRIVDQTFIDPLESVHLNDTMSIEAFYGPIIEAQVFPDFQTISTDNDVVSRDGIFESCISELKIPVIIFGRPSCNIMRSGYQNVVIPVFASSEDDIKLYHIANSIEAHATNGYATPYYDIQLGAPSAAPQFPGENDGFEFLQPFIGAELLSRTHEFPSKMLETGTGTLGLFDQITVLIDSPEGGFTESFGGPSILWIINPLTGMVVYEQTEFFCGLESGSNPCQQVVNEIQELILLLKQQLQLTSVGNTIAPTVRELKPLDLLGQIGKSGCRIHCDPYTGKKYVRLLDH